MAHHLWPRLDPVQKDGNSLCGHSSMYAGIHVDSHIGM